MNKGKRFIARGIVRVRTMVAIALLAVIGGGFLTTHFAVAAADLQNGCYDGVNAQDGVRAGGILLSPFGSTPDVCLGMETNSGYFFQLAVTIPDNAVSANPQVTAVDSAGHNIPMKQDTRKTLFVSAVPVHAQRNSVGICDNTTSVTFKITMTGVKDQTPKMPICSSNSPSGFAHDTWVRTQAANGPGGSGSARQFVGYIGINYGQTPTVDPESQYAPLKKDGIASIKITGGSCGTGGCNYNSGSKELSAIISATTDGVLVIDATALTPRTNYTIELVYNARAVDNNMPYDEWTQHTFTFKDAFLLDTGDTIITPSGFSADKLAYYDIDNNATEKRLKESTVANTTCTVEGVGWIVCPVMTFIGGINDALYGALVNFLDVDPTIFGNNSASGLYGAWSVFRTYANILFIVAFLIIVYSQITSVGITNYGIKKLLPKLIIAAILVNISYFVCQLAVDLSNILGYGLKTLFESMGSGIPASGETQSFGKVIGAAITVTGMAAGAVALILAVSVPVLLAALLALLSVILILIVRQAAIILLIAISPLAFVAWLLPNTEKWFKKWWDTFFAMLIAFPVISAIFGASALAAGILGTGNFGDDGGTAKLAALGVMTIPMISVLPILNGMIKKLGSVGNIFAGWNNKATGKVAGKVKTQTRIGRGISNALEFRAQSRASRQTRSLAGNPLTSGVLGVVGGKGYQTRLTNQASALEDKDYEEGIKAAESKFGGMTFSQIEAQANDTSASEVDRTAAIRHIMANGNFAQRRKLIETSAAMSTHQRAAVSSGALARGDQAIYGASIGDAIKEGKIGGADDAERYVAQNIADGKVKAEAMVHDVDAVKLIADVTSGGKTYDIKDAATGTVTNRTIDATERKAVQEAAAQAKKLPATAAKYAPIFEKQYVRL